MAFPVIYSNIIMKANIASYQQAWRQTAIIMTRKFGAIGSKFCTKEVGGDQLAVLIYSCWPSRELYVKNWNPENEAWRTQARDIRVKADEPSLWDHFLSMRSAAGGCLGDKMELTPDRAQQHIEDNQYVKRDSVKTDVLIYQDEGVSERGPYYVFDMLRRTLDLSFLRLKIIDAHYLCQTDDWMHNATLLIVPGGRARPYYDSLGALWEARGCAEPGRYRDLEAIGVGNEKIRTFVESGGHYLGICAGAYYGAEKTVFDERGPLEVLDPGALKLFAGAAVGPLFPYDYYSESGSSVEFIIAKFYPDPAAIYFNGGCHFVADISDQSTVLASYSNHLTESSQQKNAIVQSTVGKGTAILSGVHFEYDSCADGVTPEIAQQLKPFDDERQLFCAALLSEFNLPLQVVIYSRLQCKLRAQSTLKYKEKLMFFDSGLPFVRDKQEEVDSTQIMFRREAFERFSRDENPQVITAEAQTKGVGLNGREWHSPANVNIYATFGFLLPKEADLTEMLSTPMLVQLAALSVVRTLKDFGIESQLKWRNDVRVAGKKLAGALCEPVVKAEKNPGGEVQFQPGVHTEDDVLKVNDRLVALIGIGLDVNMLEEMVEGKEAVFEGAKFTSMRLLTGKDYDKEEVFAKLASHLRSIIELYFKEGYTPFQNEIKGLLEGLGQSIEVEDYGAGKEVFKGTILGIDDKGRLRLELEDGRERIITIGRIVKHSLDQLHPTSSMVSMAAQ